MRFEEIIGSIRMYTNIEEDFLIKKILDQPDFILDEDLLSEHDLELARKMISKGVLTKIKIKNKYFYMKI